MKPHRLKNTYLEFLIVLPALIFYLVFVIYPLFGGIYYSFTDWNGVDATFKLIGLKNYFTLAGDKYVIRPLTNTFIYAFLSMILLNVLGLALAVGLDRLAKGKNVFRALFFIPAVLSSLVVGYIFSFIFSEPISSLGKSLGIEVMANNLLGSKQFSLYMGVLVGAWKMAGWYMVIYIAGLQNIDQSLYEAADIDGTTGWKKFRYVTFPLIAPAFTINMILSVERAFKEYDLMFALTGGGPGGSSELISLTIYGESFTNKRAGYGSALGVVLFLIILAITLFQMFVLRRRENDINY
ncbi:ABC transporter permease subunit [Anaerocolumna sedimenticola]|uniref:ABC transporter permease subunit n=1 Tax=Anaerocolumna sedimenticola TaxID=2696063 RepID=A0A6P1THN8_9FIRM|nr:sugar ABC transporter permease [Anaerocolumna sedimenticola]QHQ59612.1 ABC transporter permease subunit [Anaerocolumna sedimenticola]